VIWSSLIIFILILGCNLDERDILRFSNGKQPIPYDITRDTVKNKITGELLPDSESCSTCHKPIYENWKKSRHRVSFSNSLYKKSHEEEPMTWCTNCHAPFLLSESDPTNPNERFQKEDGISCITCHVRNGKILTSNGSNKDNSIHEFQTTEILSRSEFCANCHQFNFLASKVKLGNHNDEIYYSNEPMQNTYQEWIHSSYNGRKNCQSCHLKPNHPDSHSFPGGHDANFLRETFAVEIKRTSEEEIQISIKANRLGHDFPTGDVFRTLRILIWDPNSNTNTNYDFKRSHKKSQSPSPNESPFSLDIDKTFHNNMDSNLKPIKIIHHRIKNNQTHLRLQLKMIYVSEKKEIFSLQKEDNELLFQEKVLPIPEIPPGKG
jgi:nitrate/TMAO reductase-like tetraheme cytochrome c subunit